LVKYLNEHGLDINNDVDGWTPLFSACFERHINIVKYLVELGTNIDKEDNEGYTPLLSTCQNGHEDIVKYLVELGVNIYKEFNNGNSALKEASRSGNLN